MYKNQLDKYKLEAFNFWMKHQNKTLGKVSDEEEYYVCDRFNDEFITEYESLDKFLLNYIEEYEDYPISKETLWEKLKRNGYYFINSENNTIFIFSDI